MSRDASEARSPMKPHLEIKPFQAKNVNITTSNAVMSLQSLQTSNKAEVPTVARSTTLLAKSPIKAGLADEKTSPAWVDYKSVLTNFYQVNSPEKVAEVEQTLQKYQVSKPFLSFEASSPTINS